MDGEHQVATGVVSGMMVLLKFILFVFQLLLSLSSTFSSDGAATRAWPSRSQAAMNGKIHGVRMSTGEGPCGRCGRRLRSRAAKLHQRSPVQMRWPHLHRARLYAHWTRRLRS